MDFLKTALIISLGLGLTWTADQVTGIAFAQDPVAGTESSMTDREVDEQLREAQEALDGDDSDELKDFVPSEPLSADIAIEFPSDI